MSILIETAFDKIQNPFVIKTLNKVGIEETYLKVIKTIYDKPRANLILNGEKLEVFLLRSETRQGCPLLPVLFSRVLEVLPTAIRQEKEIKGIQIRKEEIKLSLFANDILYVAFLYVNNKLSERKIKKIIPLTIALLRRIQFLGINLTNEVKDP